VSLKGSPQLRSRLKAIKLTFKPVGLKWADTTAAEARRRVPVKTGRLQKSIRRRNATQKRATVVGHFTANFVDAGTKEHPIKARHAKNLVFKTHGNTIFAKKVNHPRTRAQRFKRVSAHEGLRKTPMAAELIKLWNEAA
jgi:hypothetical protein